MLIFAVNVYNNVSQVITGQHGNSQANEHENQTKNNLVVSLSRQVRTRVCVREREILVGKSFRHHVKNQILPPPPPLPSPLLPLERLYLFLSLGVYRGSSGERKFSCSRRV